MTTNGREAAPLKIERFQPEGTKVRMSAGQPSYSHVVTISGTGKLVDMRAQMDPDVMVEIEAVAVVYS
jgi:hypothetical protein